MMDVYRIYRNGAVAEEPEVSPRYAFLGDAVFKMMALGVENFHEASKLAMIHAMVCDAETHGNLRSSGSFETHFEDRTTGRATRTLAIEAKFEEVPGGGAWTATLYGAQYEIRLEPRGGSA